MDRVGRVEIKNIGRETLLVPKDVGREIRPIVGKQYSCLREYSPDGKKYRDLYDATVSWAENNAGYWQNVICLSAKDWQETAIPQSRLNLPMFNL